MGEPETRTYELTLARGFMSVQFDISVMEQEMPLFVFQQAGPGIEKRIITPEMIFHAPVLNPGVRSTYYQVDSGCTVGNGTLVGMKPEKRSVDPMLDLSFTVQSDGPKAFKYEKAFTSRHSGELRVAIKGEYRFYVESSSAAVLHVSGARLIDLAGCSGTQEGTAFKWLGNGFHSLMVEFSTPDSAEGVVPFFKVFIESARLAKAVIPPKILFHMRPADPIPVDAGLQLHITAGSFLENPSSKAWIVRDQSGTNHNGKQPVEAARPVIGPATNAGSGLKEVKQFESIKFDGIDDEVCFDYELKEPYTCFVVSKFADEAPPEMMADKASREWMVGMVGDEIGMYAGGWVYKTEACCPSCCYYPSCCCCPSCCHC